MYSWQPVEDQLTVNVWVYFLTLYSPPLACVSVLMSELYCFNKCNFVIYFKIRKCNAYKSIRVEREEVNLSWFVDGMIYT